MLSIIVDFPVPLPPTSTFRLGLKWTDVSPRNPPSQLTARNSAWGSEGGSLLRRMRDCGSRKACRKASTETFDIFMWQDDPGFLRSSGPFTSEELMMATGRDRLYWASLFSMIGRSASGAWSAGPARAQARSSGDFHTLMRVWPESFLRS